MSNPIFVRLPRDPRCGRLARRALEQHVAGRMTPRTLDDAKIVIAELVTNAYLHGTGGIEVRIELLKDRIRLDVLDEGENAEVRVRQIRSAVRGGYGLRLVEVLALRWGAGERKTHVWAELPA
jgi:anti-sigma regulatory factor (Ser/Thr protein kinase)